MIRVIKATRNEQNSIRFGHVTKCTTPFLKNGGKIEVYPRITSGGTACRGAGSTTDSITYALTKSKQNTNFPLLCHSERTVVSRGIHPSSRFYLVLVLFCHVVDSSTPLALKA